mgnify:CR=1 FL=1
MPAYGTYEDSPGPFTRPTSFPRTYFHRFMAAHILLVEDEADIATFVEQGLAEEGYTVTWTPEGEEALELLAQESIDLVLLDLRLPGISGVEVCVRLRERWPQMPVLMLTALDTVEDKVRGLRAGADDYLPKPFDFEELLARIEALLRRSTRQPRSQVLTDGDLKLDLGGHTCVCDGESIDLTPKEFDLLAYFMAHPKRALSRDEIHKEVWGHDFQRGTNLIDVYVNYVRGKLDEVACSPRIQTVHGVGYKFVPAAEAAETLDD